MNKVVIFGLISTLAFFGATTVIPPVTTVTVPANTTMNPPVNTTVNPPVTEVKSYEMNDSLKQMFGFNSKFFNLNK